MQYPLQQFGTQEGLGNQGHPLPICLKLLRKLHAPSKIVFDYFCTTMIYLMEYTFLKKKLSL